MPRVARGAVAYALVRDGAGAHIGGGSARSYFHPGRCAGAGARGVHPAARQRRGQRDPPARAQLRVVPGQPVSFRLAFLGSRHRIPAGDPPSSASASSCVFRRSPPSSATPAATSRKAVRVEVIAAMTELGTLQLNCVSDEGPALVARIPAARCSRRSKGTRRRRRRCHHASARPSRPSTASSAAAPRPRDKGSATPAQSPRAVAGPREQWEVALLRAVRPCCSARMRGGGARPSTSGYGYNLVGFCLRPGLGDALDEWRIGQLCPLLRQGLAYLGESQNWSGMVDPVATRRGGAAGRLPGDPGGRVRSLAGGQGRQAERQPGRARSRAAATTCCACSLRSSDRPPNSRSKPATGCSANWARAPREAWLVGAGASRRASRFTAAPTRWCRPRPRPAG